MLVATIASTVEIVASVDAPHPTPLTCPEADNAPPAKTTSASTTPAIVTHPMARNQRNIHTFWRLPTSTSKPRSEHRQKGHASLFLRASSDNAAWADRRVSDSARRAAAASLRHRAARVRQAVCHHGSVRRITTVAVLTAGLLFTTASGSSARRVAAVLNLRAVTL